MSDETERILNALEIDMDQSLFEWRRRVLTAGKAEASQIINELKQREKFHYIGHNLYSNLPYYFSFEAYAYYILENKNAVIDCANKSASLFRMRNSPWNEALMHWLMSIIYQDDSRKDEECKELQMAIAILEGIAKGFRQDGRYGDCQNCQELLRQLYRSISFSQPMERVILETAKDHFLLIWIPIYTKAKSENNSVILVEPPNSDRAELHIVVIDNRWYALHYITKDKLHAVLDNEGKYGWRRVCGNSMNDARPIKLEDGDYVLFQHHQDAEEDAIVVVSQPNTKGIKEYPLIVRRFCKSKKVLCSESTERFSPIPLDKDTQILGVVMAVAKPLIPSEKQLYQTLLDMVGGDKAIVKRLIQIEQKLAQKASHENLLKRAISKLKCNKPTI